MTTIDPAKCRTAADQCLERSLSFTDPREWIRFSQEWEKIAETPATLTATKLRRAQNAAGSRRVGGSESCANLSKTLLLAGVFCARKNPSFRCDPLSCNI